MMLGRHAAWGLACAVILTMASESLAAQRLEVGGAVGLAMPIREFHGVANIGLEEAAMVKFQPGTAPVSIRLDFIHARFGGRAAPGLIFPRTRTTGVAGGAEYDFDGGEESRWRGWAFGGLGAFYTIADQGTPEIPPFGRTYFGIQAGIGGAYRMGLLNPFVELRYATIYRSNAKVKTLPLLIGIRLGRRASDLY